MESQFRPYTSMSSSTQMSKAPLRLYVGIVYLAIGLILYLFAN